MTGNVVDLQAHKGRELPASEAAEQALWQPPTVRVMAAAMAVFGVTVGQLLGRNRTDRFCAARAAVVWVSRQMNVSYRHLGARMKRDHGGVRRIYLAAERRRGADPHFVRCCDTVLRRARGS